MVIPKETEIYKEIKEPDSCLYRDNKLSFIY